MDRSYDEEIILVTRCVKDSVVEEIKYSVMAEKLSVTRSEVYAAYQAGLIAKWVFAVNPEDYEMTRQITVDGNEVYATKVIYNNTEYLVIRTYGAKGGDLEVVVK